MSDNDDGDELAGRLDEDFAEWNAALSFEQCQAIRTWQRADDRFYQRIQRVFRVDVPDAEAEDVAEHLVASIDAGLLARDVVMWRGLRNTGTVFGVRSAELTGLVDSAVSSSGLLAVSTSRRVAVAEFTRPPLGSGPVLLRVAIPAGTPAAWVSAAGDASLRYQGELLLGDGHRVRVVALA